MTQLQATERVEICKWKFMIAYPYEKGVPGQSSMGTPFATLLSADIAGNGLHDKLPNARFRIHSDLSSAPGNACRARFPVHAALGREKRGSNEPPFKNTFLYP